MDRWNDWASLHLSHSRHSSKSSAGVGVGEVCGARSARKTSAPKQVASRCCVTLYVFISFVILSVASSLLFSESCAYYDAGSAMEDLISGVLGIGWLGSLSLRSWFSGGVDNSTAVGADRHINRTSSVFWAVGARYDVNAFSMQRNDSIAFDQTLEHFLARSFMRVRAFSLHEAEAMRTAVRRVQRCGMHFSA